MDGTIAGKNSDKQALNKEALAKLTKIDDLPALPSVVANILGMANDGNSSMQSMAGVIQKDSAISSALLKVANSALYGSRGSISNVSQALSLIGLNAAIPIIVSLSLRGLQTSFNSPLNFEDYWRRSVLCSSIATFLSRFTECKKEDALLAGLIQDIGVLAISAHYPDEYQHCKTDIWSSHRNLRVFEQTLIGFDHAAVSVGILESWGFPKGVVTAVSLSHKEPTPLDRNLAWCVSGANQIADAIMVGIAEDRLVAGIYEMLHAYWLPLEPSEYDAVLTDCMEAISHAEQLFEAQILPKDIESMLTEHADKISLN